MRRVPRVARSAAALALAVGVVSDCAEAQGIDAFVAEARARQGLAASAPADPITWLRRVSLDLTGLPPTPSAARAFAADERDGARERAVDALLASPAYGERWAVWWLDLARYADSQGYEKDGLRPTMWRYRDWVIDALNRDMPFDRFTIEQIAGDLLPDATLEQRLATAFHRQTMTNTEGGTDDEEFRVAAVIDRVDTTMSVWMGATAGCAQCHDHKFDPISQREFYGLYAFFDQTADRDRPDDSPTLAVPTAAQREVAAPLETELADLRARLTVDDATVLAWGEGLRAAVAAFEAANVEQSSWHLLGPIPAADFDTACATEFAVERDGVRLDAEQDGLRWQEKPEFVDGAVHTWRGDNSAFYLHRVIDAAAAAPAVLVLGSDDALEVWWNGAQVFEAKVSRGAAPEQEFVPVALRPGRNDVLLKVTNGGSVGGFCFELRPTQLPREDVGLLALPGGDYGDAEIARLRRAYERFAPEVAPLRRRIAAVAAELAQNAGPAVPVMAELAGDERRTTRLLLRGSFLTPGEAVEPHTPACWPPLPATAPRDRLSFARWLVSPDNPRTARVIANRLWAELFGRGLVETLEDFGSQGEPCSHPELLDWLGAEFVRGGWSIKRLLRTIVLSETYGQSSEQTAELRERDPYDVWHARGPAFRMNGEMLRDQALAVAGLLSATIGGPSVMPPQPDGVWAQIYSGARWVAADGEDRHRRSLYTFWRRLSPHPAMLILDAQTRESCVLRRSRTNTPLQALVLWNDPQFTEAASALADRLLAECGDGGGGDAECMRWLWRRCLLREPTATELERLLALLGQERTAGADERLQWTVLASVVMNLDEFVTKR